MSSAERLFLDSGRPISESGSRRDFGLSFTSESDLDHHLWLDPEVAEDDLRFLLKVHQGDMSPALSRLALKAVALPLFKREFYGDDTPIQVIRAVRDIPQQNSRLLNAYMDRVDDDQIDQTMLRQAIDDTTVLQLVSRSFKSNTKDDIVLLPAGPEEDYVDKPTTFTVLRRRSLGRALLFVSNARPVAYIHTPQSRAHRIQIRPDDLLIDGANRFDLAEALITDQRGDVDDSMLPDERDLLRHATGHVTDKITTHFDRIQPRR
ncbi:MAG: hypothetical protein EOT05_02735 [Candidatus Microsaccharimonas sossegonensis]|uniref:Uncharacterized protein n=1 Tax=Candidatus Microsaccharimonas sossegonensis TaxID=2506948 RepID=A0A4Q0AHJ0_9BACT|nr:MAG: hypothetical protein EOT05_02735 [Candidatus Microsaccharimonas sossegonensis]